MDRIVIFIDNSYIFKGFQKYNVQADYEKLKNIITTERDLRGIYLYEGVIYPINPAKANWYKKLHEKSGYIIKATFDKIISKGAIEKKVDINIAVDIISLGYENAYDVAVLVSGDGDFVPVIKKVLEMDKRIEIWAFKYSLANTLIEETGLECIKYLDDVLSEIMLE